ncbi:MAG: insulinase family protein [Patescibacteria group bacterium]|nr:insulinase family protein [Patescibacteria group bacterium]
MFIQSRLSNGAKVILAPMKNTKAVTALALLPFGSRYEKKEENGQAHFIEHMLFKGTKNRPSTLAISQELDSLGADYNAFTSRESTGYWIKILKENLNQSLDILADIFFNSLFEPKELEKEKTVILEEIRFYQDNPSFYISDLFYETFFGDHPLGRNIAGCPETIMSVNQEKLLNFKEKIYQPNNLLLVLAGAVGKKDFCLVEKYFGRKGRGEKRKFEKFTLQPHLPKIKIAHRPTEQVQMMIGFPGLSYFSPAIEVLEIFSTLFGGNMSSRLFQEVRVKRGLAYSVGCSGISFYETGLLTIEAGIDPKKVAETLEVIVEEIRKIKKEGPSEREVEQTKDYLIRKIKLNLEDSQTMAGWYGHQALYLRKIETPEEKFRKIKKVTKEQIKKLGQRIFNQNFISLALVGPLQEEKSFLEILKNV